MTTKTGPTEAGSAFEVFKAFLRLGLTSFGGPIAHIGYYREEFVVRRGWLSEQRFSQLLAVCQFLPGPASSQMGFAIGLFKAGWRGALSAFTAFSLPSALLLFGFAGISHYLDTGAGAAAVHGLKLVAVAVVAHAVLGMAHRLTPDIPRIFLAAIACALIVAGGTAWMQLIAIVTGGLLGLWFCRHVTTRSITAFPTGYGNRTALFLLGVFTAGLIAAFVFYSATPSASALAAAFYQAGSLVFGGGHVVLPLLKETTVTTGWISADTFLSGYGAAQAIPGPLFTLSAFLGAEIPVGLPPAVAALLALLAIFLPGFLLLLAILPIWGTLAASPKAGSAMAGINAAVVGLLAAALYDPVWTDGIQSITDVVIATVSFCLLMVFRLSVLWIVAWSIIATVSLFYINQHWIL